MIPVQDLDIYKLAEELSDIIWFEFDKWPKKVQNTTGYQVIDSSDSIAANLAEGFTDIQEDHLKKQRPG